MTLDLSAPIAVLAVAFTLSGLMKVAGVSRSRSDFRRWGFPSFFRVTVGVVELACAALLLTDGGRSWGAGVLLVTMFGALGTHIKFREWAVALLPVVLSVLLIHTLLVS